MSVSQSGNRTHDVAVAVAEAARQAVVTKTATRATILAAEIAFFRACITSAVATGINPEQYQTALKELGTGGV